MAKLVSKVYGDALFEEAVEKNCVAGWYDEVQALRTIFTENSDLVQLLNHPQIVKEEKVKVMENIFSGRVSEGVMGFLVTVLEKGRQNDILSIFDYFIARVKEYKKIGVVLVTSAAELSSDQRTKIQEKILATTEFVSLEMSYTVDPGLIGGLVIRIGDRVVDSSIRTQLSELKRELMKLQLA